MPDVNGIGATRRITGSDEGADVRVLILTTFDLDEYVYAALRAGASGFLVKDTPPADPLTAIRVIAAGNARDRAQLLIVAYETGLVRAV